MTVPALNTERLKSFPADKLLALERQLLEAVVREEEARRRRIEEAKAKKRKVKKKKKK
jgi:hypothetical protein